PSHHPTGVGRAVCALVSNPIPRLVLGLLLRLLPLPLGVAKLLGTYGGLGLLPPPWVQLLARLAEGLLAAAKPRPRRALNVPAITPPARAEGTIGASVGQRRDRQTTPGNRHSSRLRAGALGREFSFGGGDEHQAETVGRRGE